MDAEVRPDRELGLPVGAPDSDRQESARVAGGGG